MPQSRSGRITRTGGRGVAEGGEKQSKKTFIVKVPSKAQTDDANSVFESEAMDAEAADDTDFTQTIILQNRDEGEEEGARGDTDQTDNLADFELNNIPMEMAVDGGKTDKSDLLSSYLLADHINLNNTSIGLDQAGGIRDHVISIEENGRITIEKIGIEDEDQDEDQEVEELGVARLLSGGKQPHTPPRFPEWWLRLSSTLLSFLSTVNIYSYSLLFLTFSNVCRATWWTCGWCAATERQSPPTSSSSATPPRAWPPGWQRQRGNK